VTFELAGPTRGSFCVGSDCDNTWLSILRADRTPVAIARSCTADCDQCVALGCTGACPAPTALPATGVRATWNGTTYASDRCGAAQLSCALAQCAQPGRYIARMCVYRADVDAGPSTGQCRGTTTPTCAEVTFDWPTQGPIVGKLD
jgi:hypothetical protein